MIIAGGGAGGGNSGTDTGAGGGAGGYRTSPALSVTPGMSMTVVVGAGGANNSAPGNGLGSNGSNSGLYGTSPFSAVWSTGGGAGGTAFNAGTNYGLS